MALVVALAIVAATGAFALRTHGRVVATWRDVARTNDILSGLGAMLVDMVDAETGQRGFVITGDETFLEPFRLAEQRSADDLSAVEVLVEDARVRDLLDRVRPLVERKLALSRETIELRRTSGFSAAAERIATHRGKETMDEIRRLVSAMRERERELLVQRTTIAQAEARFADQVFLFATALSVLLIAGAFFFLRREVDARQASEERLRREGAMSEAILTAMADAVVVADPDGALVLMNPSAERLFGRKLAGGGAGGDFVSALPLLLPDGATPYPPEERPLSRALRGEVVDGAECAIRLASAAAATWLTASARPLYTPDGRRLGGVGILHDVTTIKRVDAELQERNASLATSVRDLERRNEEVSLLGELTGLLQACRDEEEASAVIAQSLGHLFATSRGGVYLLNPSRNLVFASAVWGEPPPDERTFAPDDCWALRRGHAHQVEATRLALRCAHVGADVAQCICLPLMAQGDALGVLHVRPATRGDAAPALDRRLLDAVADEVGLALANLRLRDSLRQQSIRDPLTNLYNRRYMEESFERELQRAARRGAQIGVLMIDVDHFKGFNDSYGHAAGDALLCELGAMLKASVRGEDLACRYGGEEFLVLLPDATLADTTARAEQLRTKAKGIVVQHGDRNLRTVSLSIGVALFPDHGREAHALVQVADRALYRAKGEGRDRIVVAQVVTRDEHAA